jgi:hypothetical protein
MGLLDDTSLDTRARPIITKKWKVNDTLLERAALLEEAPSPAMLESAAEWLTIIDDLADAGFTPVEILRLLVRVDRDTFDRHGPDISILEHLFAIPEGLEIARALCEELLAVEERTHQQQRLANAALVRLAQDGAIDPRFDALFHWSPIEPAQLRTLFGALPTDRRDALVIAHSQLSTKSDTVVARNAAFKLDHLLWIADLAPAARGRFAELLEAAKADRDHAKLAAEVASNKPRVLEARPTPKAQRALEYLTGTMVKAKRAGDINPLAQDAYARRLSVDAPELSTVAAWIAAGPKRQKQIALAVAKALASHTGTASKVVDIATFGGAPIATIACGKHRFCLVPGGTFEMGFSEEEEAAVRAASEVNAGCGNHWELYEQLFAQVDAMRPITHVRVQPMLVEQGRTKTLELDEATDVLAESPFRVPSEAEWEYLARGGKLRELTYRGDVVPDHEGWFEETAKLGVKGANAFGLWGFGYEPELCADAWHETLDDQPRDGTPRRGDGARVTRGGAAQLYPWQATGEWHMLLSAFRMSSSAWEFAIALRFVLGIDCGARAN